MTSEPTSTRTPEFIEEVRRCAQSPAAPSTLQAVRRLLHDWVKYMDMRLLSIDWTAPPSNLVGLLRKGIQQTRRSRSGVQGVKQLWEAERGALSELPSSVTALDSAVDRILSLLEDDVRGTLSAVEIDAVIRRPGAMLRPIRDILAEHVERDDDSGDSDDLSEFL